MSRYAYVVSACSKYTPELCALLNSLDFIGNQEDVHVLGYKLPKEFVDQFGKIGYRVIHHNIPEPEARQFGGEGEILCRKRYWYAALWGQEYEAICLLDADMFFVRPVTQFFDVAAKTGFLLGAGLEQKRVYGNHAHQTVGGRPILQEPRWNDKDVCCAPIFVDVRGEFGKVFRRSWEIFEEGFPESNFKAPDMEAVNICIMSYGLSGKVVLLPNYSWVATNEKLLKPYTRAILQSDGKLWTESGEPLYIVHGQFYKARWRLQQLLNRHGCIKGCLDGSPRAYAIAEGALNCVNEVFQKMLDWRIQVPKVAYVPSGEPGPTGRIETVGV